MSTKIWWWWWYNKLPWTRF